MVWSILRQKIVIMLLFSDCKRNIIEIRDLESFDQMK